MTDRTENIEQQIDETKASLVGKLEVLEDKVAEAVQETSETVSDTVGAVKETVDKVKEKVRSAGEFLDLRRQAERNPWMVFGGAVAAGCLAGYLFSGSSRSESRRRQSPAEQDGEPERDSTASEPEKATERPERKHSWFRDQLGSLQGLAVGTLMGAIRDLAASNMPEGLGKSISQEVDRFTTNLGAKPINGPVIPQPKEPVAPPKQPAA